MLVPIPVRRNGTWRVTSPQGERDGYVDLLLIDGRMQSISMFYVRLVGVSFIVGEPPPKSLDGWVWEFIGPHPRD